MAAGDNRGRLAIFDAATSRLKGVPFRTAKPIQLLAFSPDSSRLVVVSGNVDGGALDVLDARSFRTVSHHRIPHPGEDVFGSVAFTRDSRAFVLAYERYRFEEEPLGIVQRWRPGTVGRSAAGNGCRAPAACTSRSTPTAGSSRSASPIARSPSATPGSLRTLRRYPVGRDASATAVSDDGREVALAGQDGSLRVLDLATGRARLAQGRHATAVESVSFTPNGHAILTGADDGTVVLHELGGGAETFEGHAARVAALAPSPDGLTGYSASLDGTVIAWDLDGTRRFGRRFGATSGADLAAPFGVIDRQSERGRRQHRLRAGWRPRGDPAAGRGREPDGYPDAALHRPAAGVGRSERDRLGERRQLRRPDDRDDLRQRHRPLLGRPVAQAAEPAAADSSGLAGWGPSFSGDGRLLSDVGSGGGFHVVMWDARRHVKVRPGNSGSRRTSRTRRRCGRTGELSSFRSKAEPEPATSTSSRCRPCACQADPAPLRALHPLLARRRLLAVGDYEGVVRLYDGHTFQPHGRPLRGHAGAIYSADFSPDGRMIVTGSADGTVRLWDTATGGPIGAPLPGIPNVPVGAAFTRGGTHVGGLRQRPRLPVGRAAVVVAAPRVRDRRPPAHPRGVGRRAAGPQVRAGVRVSRRPQRAHPNA